MPSNATVAAVAPDPDPERIVKRAQQLPSPTHHVIVKLETVHVGSPEIDETHLTSRGLTHEVITYRYTPGASDAALAAARMKDASVVMTTTVPINAETLKEASFLKCVIAESTGINHIDIDECRRRGITVYSTPNASTESVSEHALAMYFSLRRKLVVLHNSMMRYDDERPNAWKASGSMSSLVRDSNERPPLTCESEVVGVLGGGLIGQRIATLCRNLGMDVLISARKTAPTDAPCPAGRTPFSEVVRSATVLFVVLPLTPETTNVIGAPELAAMRPEAVIVNVGRGGLVDEGALLDAVRRRAIFGAATDVYVKEPAGSDADSCLLSKEVAREGLNMVLTPHLAWVAESTRRTITKTVGGSVREFIDGGTRNMVSEGRNVRVDGA